MPPFLISMRAVEIIHYLHTKDTIHKREEENPSELYRMARRNGRAAEQRTNQETSMDNARRPGLAIDTKGDLRKQSKIRAKY